MQDENAREAGPDEVAATVRPASTGGGSAAGGPLRRWGHLELLEQIGEGAYGEVFRARDPRLDRVVALKLLHPLTAGEPSIAKRVIQEGSLLARFRHPNLITVYGAERHEERIGLWMELIHGRTLAELLDEQGTLGAREAALVGLDLCRALAAVHREGLVHRDVKAQNVMREAGGRILLMDLGATLDLHSIEDTDERSSITGTPLYMAPEILKGQPATPRSDIYSLGVLLYHLVTGAYPVTGRSLRELQEAHAAGRAVRLRDARPDLPDAFVQVVEHALNREPDRRFESAGGFEAALAATLGSAGVFPVAAAAFPPDRPQRSKPGPSRYLWAGVGAALVLVAAVALAIAFRRPIALEPLGGSASEQAQPERNPESQASEPIRPVEEPRPGAVTDSTRKPGPREIRPADTARANPPTPSPQIPRPPPPDPVPEQVAARPPAPAPTPALAPEAIVATATLYRDTKETVLDEPLTSGAKLRPQDQIYLEIEGPQPLYVYVINQPQVGQSYVLFPLAGAALHNPLDAGVRHRLPGVVGGKRLNWTVNSAGGRESFLVIAADRRLEELDPVLAQIQQASLGAPVEVQPQLITRVRGLGGLAEAEPPAPGSERQLLAERLRALAGRGIWMREIVLENPAE